MELPPFLHQPQNPARQMAPQERVRADGDLCLVLALFSVKVRGQMIVIVETDHKSG